MQRLYVQYGCGMSAPKEWINFDISPTLRLQKIPLLGQITTRLSGVKFPKNVKYGDIIASLPLAEASCDGVYCSHTLEHLSLNDFKKSLKNTYKILKNGGMFRCIVPDLEPAARTYVNALDQGNSKASIEFVGKNTLLGTVHRSKKLTGLLRSYYGNSNHLWMWDYFSLKDQLEQAGFSQIRRCYFNDSRDDMFSYVEDESRFVGALAIECKK